MSPVPCLSGTVWINSGYLIICKSSVVRIMQVVESFSVYPNYRQRQTCRIDCTTKDLRHDWLAKGAAAYVSYLNHRRLKHSIQQNISVWCIRPLSGFRPDTRSISSQLMFHWKKNCNIFPNWTGHYFYTTVMTRGKGLSWILDGGITVRGVH